MDHIDLFGDPMVDDGPGEHDGSTSPSHTARSSSSSDDSGGGNQRKKRRAASDATNNRRERRESTTANKQRKREGNEKSAGGALLLSVGDALAPHIRPTRTGLSSSLEPFALQVPVDVDCWSKAECGALNRTILGVDTAGIESTKKKGPGTDWEDTISKMKATGITATDPSLTIDPSGDSIPLAVFYLAPMLNPAFQYNTPLFNPMLGVPHPTVGVNLSLFFYHDHEQPSPPIAFKDRAVRQYRRVLLDIESIHPEVNSHSYLQEAARIVGRHHATLTKPAGELTFEEREYKEAFVHPVASIHLYSAAGPPTNRLFSKMERNISPHTQANGVHQGLFGHKNADTIVVAFDTSVIANSSLTNTKTSLFTETNVAAPHHLAQRSDLGMPNITNKVLAYDDLAVQLKPVLDELEKLRPRWVQKNDHNRMARAEQAKGENTRPIPAIIEDHELDFQWTSLLATITNSIWVAARRLVEWRQVLLEHYARPLHVSVAVSPSTQWLGTIFVTFYASLVYATGQIPGWSVQAAQQMLLHHCPPVAVGYVGEIEFRTWRKRGDVDLKKALTGGGVENGKQSFCKYYLSTQNARSILSTYENLSKVLSPSDIQRLLSSPTFKPLAVEIDEDKFEENENNNHSASPSYSPPIGDALGVLLPLSVSLKQTEHLFALADLTFNQQHTCTSTGADPKPCTMKIGHWCVYSMPEKNATGFAALSRTDKVATLNYCFNIADTPITNPTPMKQSLLSLAEENKIMLYDGDMFHLELDAPPAGTGLDLGEMRLLVSPRGFSDALRGSSDDYKVTGCKAVGFTSSGRVVGETLLCQENPLEAGKFFPVGLEARHLEQMESIDKYKFKKVKVVNLHPTPFIHQALDWAGPLLKRQNLRFTCAPLMDYPSGIVKAYSSSHPCMHFNVQGNQQLNTIMSAQHQALLPSTFAFPIPLAISAIMKVITCFPLPGAAAAAKAPPRYDKTRHQSVVIGQLQKTDAFFSPPHTSDNVPFLLQLNEDNFGRHGGFFGRNLVYLDDHRISPINRGVKQNYSKLIASLVEKATTGVVPSGPALLSLENYIFTELHTIAEYCMSGIDNKKVDSSAPPRSSSSCNKVAFERLPPEPLVPFKMSLNKEWPLPSKEEIKWFVVPGEGHCGVWTIIFSLLVQGASSLEEMKRMIARMDWASFVQKVENKPHAIKLQAWAQEQSATIKAWLRGKEKKINDASDGSVKKGLQMSYSNKEEELRELEANSAELEADGEVSPPVFPPFQEELFAFFHTKIMPRWIQSDQHTKEVRVGTPRLEVRFGACRAVAYLEELRKYVRELIHFFRSTDPLFQPKGNQFQHVSHVGFSDAWLTDEDMDIIAVLFGLERTQHAVEQGSSFVYEYGSAEWPVPVRERWHDASRPLMPIIMRNIGKQHWTPGFRLAQLLSIFNGVPEPLKEKPQLEIAATAAESVAMSIDDPPPPLPRPEPLTMQALRKRMLDVHRVEQTPFFAAGMLVDVQLNNGLMFSESLLISRISEESNDGLLHLYLLADHGGFPSDAELEKKIARISLHSPLWKQLFNHELVFSAEKITATTAFMLGAFNEEDLAGKDDDLGSTIFVHSKGQLNTITAQLPEEQQPFFRYLQRGYIPLAHVMLNEHSNVGMHPLRMVLAQNLRVHVENILSTTIGEEKKEEEEQKEADLPPHSPAAAPDIDMQFQIEANATDPPAVPTTPPSSASEKGEEEEGDQPEGFEIVMEEEVIEEEAGTVEKPVAKPMETEEDDDDCNHTFHGLQSITSMDDSADVPDEIGIVTATPYNPHEGEQPSILLSLTPSSPVAPSLPSINNAYSPPRPICMNLFASFSTPVISSKAALNEIDLESLTIQPPPTKSKEQRCEENLSLLRQQIFPFNQQWDSYWLRRGNSEQVLAKLTTKEWSIASMSVNRFECFYQVFGVLNNITPIEVKEDILFIVFTLLDVVPEVKQYALLILYGRFEGEVNPKLPSNALNNQELPTGKIKIHRMLEKHYEKEGAPETYIEGKSNWLATTDTYGGSNEAMLLSFYKQACEAAKIPVKRSYSDVQVWTITWGKNIVMPLMGRINPNMKQSVFVAFSGGNHYSLLFQVQPHVQVVFDENSLEFARKVLGHFGFPRTTSIDAACDKDDCTDVPEEERLKWTGTSRSERREREAAKQIAEEQARRLELQHKFTQQQELEQKRSEEEEAKQLEIQQRNDSEQLELELQAKKPASPIAAEWEDNDVDMAVAEVQLKEKDSKEHSDCFVEGTDRRHLLLVRYTTTDFMSTHVLVCGKCNQSIPVLTKEMGGQIKNTKNTTTDVLIPSLKKLVKTQGENVGDPHQRSRCQTAIRALEDLERVYYEAEPPSCFFHAEYIQNSKIKSVGRGVDSKIEVHVEGATLSFYRFVE